MEMSIKTLAELSIYVVMLVLTIYGVMLWFHWFNYGASKAKSTAALLIYIGGSAVIIASLTITFSYLH